MSSLSIHSTADMKYLVIIYMILSLSFLSCTPSVSSDQESQEDYSSLLLNVKKRFALIKETEKHMTTIRSNWDNSFFINRDSSSIEALEKVIDAESIPVLFTEFKRVQKVTDDTNYVEGEVNDDEKSDSDNSEEKIKKPNTIFHFRQEVHGYTLDYLEKHLFTPDYIDMYINEHDNLFLSLGSTQRGPMYCTVFNQSNSYNHGGFSNNIYDGSFLQGHLIQEMDSLGDVTVVLMIGDSIHITDFTRTELLGELGG